MKIYGGIDIGGTSIKLGYVAEDGELLCKDNIPIHTLPTYQDLIEAVYEKMTALAAELGNAAIQGYGVGSPGNINSKSGEVVWLQGKLEYLQGQNVIQDLKRKFGKPILFDNDVNTILMGEWQFGAAKNYQNVLGLTLGTGIGGAIIINGKLVHGAHHASANFGYLSMRPDGIPHVCGNAGAVENYASHAGLVDRVKNRLAEGAESSLSARLAADGPEFGFRQVFEESGKGDPLAVELIDDFVKELAVLLANLLLAFDPEAILIGGGIIKAGPAFFKRITDTAKSRIASFPAETIHILPMSLGEYAGIYGGAALVVEGLK